MDQNILAAAVLLLLDLVVAIVLLRQVLKRSKEGTKRKGRGSMTQDPSSSSYEDTQVFKVSPDMNLAVKGLPASLPREERNKILTSLVRSALANLPQRTYQAGDRIYQGRARLRVQDKIYPVVFAVDATRVLTALETYKAAFDEIHAGAAAGTYDQELAALTAEHVKRMAWEEVQGFKGRQQVLRQEGESDKLPASSEKPKDIEVIDVSPGSTQKRAPHD